MKPFDVSPGSTVLSTLIALGFSWVAGCSHPQQPPATVVARTAVEGGNSTRRAPPTPVRSEPVRAQTDDNAGKRNKELAVYFDFDSAVLRDDARPVLQKIATIARSRDSGVRIEGNCDEVGTVEYNIALGEHRAMQAKDYLTHMGVAPAKIQTVSYGAQRPKAAGHDETAHAENRRDDLIVR